MTLQAIIISAVVGIITSAVTAYITTRLKLKEERDKWRREFAFKFAEAQVANNGVAKSGNSVCHWRFSAEPGYAGTRKDLRASKLSPYGWQGSRLYDCVG